MERNGTVMRQGGDARGAKVKKKLSKQKKSAAGYEFQGQNGSEERQKCTSSYIIEVDLDVHRSDLLKKITKKTTDAQILNLNPGFLLRLVVVIYHTSTHRHARARLHTWTYASPHSGTLLEIKQDPRQQPRPLKLQ